MVERLTQAELDALAAWDTPTICNALEIVAPERRALGFNRRPLVAPFPGLKPAVGYARTATIRSREPAGRAKDEARKHRIAYYEYVAAEPHPKILTRAEKVLIVAAKRPGFSEADLRKALSEADEIH